MGNIGRPASIGVGHGCHTGDLDVRPSQQHDQGACVVSVPAQISIEVDSHSARMALSDNEPTPVKQLVLDEETREAARAGADQIAVELSLESLNVLCDVTLDQRGVPFEWTAER